MVTVVSVVQVARKEEEEEEEEEEEDAFGHCSGSDLRYYGAMVDGCTHVYVCFWPRHGFSSHCVDYWNGTFFVSHC